MIRQSFFVTCAEMNSHKNSMYLMSYKIFLCEVGCMHVIWCHIAHLTQNLVAQLIALQIG